MPWIPMALSTFRPATSPCLSFVRLDFYSVNDQPITTVTTEMSDDLRCIEAEIARIEREFEGAVGFAVVPGSKFRVVLDSLNVRFCFVCVGETSQLC